MKQIMYKRSVLIWLVLCTYTVTANYTNLTANYINYTRNLLFPNLTSNRSSQVEGNSGLQKIHNNKHKAYILPINLNETYEENGSEIPLPIIQRMYKIKLSTLDQFFGKRREDAIVFPSNQTDIEVFSKIHPKRTAKLRTLAGSFSPVAELRSPVAESSSPRYEADNVEYSEDEGGFVDATDNEITMDEVEYPEEATCKPEMTIVPLGKKDISVKYIPSCTRVMRCGGPGNGCCNADQLICQPTNTRIRKFQVYPSTYKKGRIVVEEPVVVSIVEHTKCTCGCRVKADHCNANQEYDTPNCRCRCNNHEERKFCMSNNLTIWDHSSCTCQCRHVTECSTGQYFSMDTCSCTSSSLGSRFGGFWPRLRGQKPRIMPRRRSE